MAVFPIIKSRHGATKEMEYFVKETKQKCHSWAGIKFRFWFGNTRSKIIQSLYVFLLAPP